MGNGGKGGRFSGAIAKAEATCNKDRKASSATQPCPLKKKKVIMLRWDPEEAWCSEHDHIRAATQGYADGETLVFRVEDDRDVSFVDYASANLKSNACSAPWDVVNVLPRKTGGKWDKFTKLSAFCEPKISENRLEVKFLPDLPKTLCRGDRRYSLRPFYLSAKDYEIRIDADLKYVKGWAADVVKLGRRVPASTGGLLAKKPGYRWSKTVGGRRKFWDGSRWRDLPRGYRIRVTNYETVAFYKKGTKFVSDEGLEWPENFTDWDINAADKQEKIRKWETEIEGAWADSFDLKRVECRSTEPKCCRYRTTHVKARFVQVTAYGHDVIVVAQGEGRSHTALFCLGDAATMAAHEFGHYLGNPDEYKGGEWFDATLNGDGAVNGIDKNSIMNSDWGMVKKRHYRFICSQLTKMIKARCGKTWTFKAVEVISGVTITLGKPKVVRRR